MAPAALLAAAALAAAAAAMDAEKTPIRLAYQSVYWAVPPYVAKREGYFDALGLDVEFLEVRDKEAAVNCNYGGATARRSIAST